MQKKFTIGPKRNISATSVWSLADRDNFVASEYNDYWEAIEETMGRDFARNFRADIKDRCDWSKDAFDECVACLIKGFKDYILSDAIDDGDIDSDTADKLLLKVQHHSDDIVDEISYIAYTDTTDNI